MWRPLLFFRKCSLSATASYRVLSATTPYRHHLSTSVSSEQDSIEYYGRKRQTNVSLRALLDTGNGTLLNVPLTSRAETATATDKVLLQVACFLHRELPVRLAHRACELESSDVFKQSESIMSVCQWYKTSFHELRDCPAPVNAEKEMAFSKVIGTTLSLPTLFVRRCDSHHCVVVPNTLTYLPTHLPTRHPHLLAHSPPLGDRVHLRAAFCDTHYHGPRCT